MLSHFVLNFLMNVVNLKVNKNLLIPNNNVTTSDHMNYRVNILGCPTKAPIWDR